MIFVAVVKTFFSRRTAIGTPRTGTIVHLQATRSGLSAFWARTDAIKEGVNAMLSFFGGNDVGGDAVGAIGRLVPGGAVCEGDGDFVFVAFGAGPEQRISDGGCHNQKGGANDVDGSNVAMVAKG